MPEPLRDDLHWHAGLEGKGRPRVAKVVETDLREVETRDLAFERTSAARERLSGDQNPEEERAQGAQRGERAKHGKSRS